MFSRVTAPASRKRRKIFRESSASSEETIDHVPPTKMATVDEPVEEVTVPTPQPDAICQHEKELFALQKDLGSMREVITCKICQRFLAEPYGLACGHTYCYICLDTWLVAQKKNSCPECRAVISEQPVPSLAIRDMVAIFSSRLELLPDEETLEDLALNAREGAEMVAKDKAESSTGQPFKGVFSNTSSGRRRGLRQSIYDADDHVHRCPDCFHEVEHGICSSCGGTFESAGDSFDEEDFDLDDFDDENIFGVESPEGEERSAFSRRAPFTHARALSLSQRARRDNAIREAIVRRVMSGGMPGDRSESDDDEHDSEMDDFVVPDDVEDSEESSESDGDDAPPTRSAARHRANLVPVTVDDDSSSEDSDEPVVPSQRGTRGRAARLNAAEDSSASNAVQISDDSDEVPVRSQRQKRTTRSGAARSRPVVLDIDSEEEEDDGETAEGVYYGSSSASVQTETTNNHDTNDDDLADENGMRFSDLIAGRINNDWEDHDDNTAW